MNTKRYEEMFETLKEYHPYIAQDVEDYWPKSDKAIRLATHDGTRYEFNSVTKTVRRIANDLKLQKGQFTDEQCRESFALHLSEMMETRGHNQQSLSECTGISKGAIYSYLNEKKTPSLTNVRKIAYALDCSITELLD